MYEHRFASAHLFGAVCPARDTGVALVLPEVSTAAMDVFLAELARAIPQGTHAVLVLDHKRRSARRNRGCAEQARAITPPMVGILEEIKGGEDDRGITAAIEYY